MDSLSLFDSSVGCSQCQMCPGGTEALQPAAEDCTPCRPGNVKAQGPLNLCSLQLVTEKGV